MLRRITTALLLVTCGCSTQAEPSSGSQQIFSSRDEGKGNIIRFPLYTAWVPESWKREDPPTNSSNADTTLPICTFHFDDATIYVHSFPYETIEQRIPPKAQISRWQGQLNEIQETSLRTTPVSHGGYSGFYLDVRGEREGSPQRIIGWAMQLYTDHYRNLHLEKTAYEHHYYTQLRSDYTIKAVGASDTLQKILSDLEQFGASFALLEEVPQRV